MLMVQVDGTDILLVHLDGRVHALQGICSHEYFELDKGFLTGDSIDLRAPPVAVRPRHR